MRVEYDAELRVAVAEGLLDHRAAEAVRKEADRRDCSPLSILKEDGKITEETLHSLSGLARESLQSVEALEDTACGATPSLGQLSRQVGDFAPPVFPVKDWERYEPVRFLGQGGMGKVFLARDRHLGRQVAIKFVRGDDSDVAIRFLSEARAQARVQHEHVCKVYEVGQVEGKVYIAMQYIDGQPLGSIAATLTVEQRAMVLRAAALGLHEAHRVGIIHRDIKPGDMPKGFFRRRCEWLDGLRTARRTAPLGAPACGMQSLVGMRRAYLWGPLAGGGEERDAAR